MYGKFFASTFSGSMYGAGSHVFAVWGYVIAHAVEGQVELNPRLLASAIGSSEEEIASAIEYLCSPDPNSRSPLEGGKRLIREGQYAYRVTNHAAYKTILNEAERRAYNRKKKQESRQRQSKSRIESLTVNDMSAVSAHTEAEAEADTEQKLTTAVAKAPASPWSKEACQDWISRYQGTAPGGRIGKALKPLIAEHGWPEVREAWQSYLQQTEPEYASPQRFASTYGRWSGNGQTALAITTSPKAQQRENSMMAMIKGGLRHDR